MADTTSPAGSATCAQCQQTKGSLKNCAKCKSVYYCNKDCQKAHWKVHKKDCASLAQNRQNGDSPSSAPNNHPSAGPDLAPFTAINNNTYLHHRSEEKTFQILIECLRMRQEDVYTLEHDNMDGTIYNRQNRSGTSEPAFRTFIQKAQRVSGFLPPWWNDAKTDECVQYGRRTDHNFSLAHAVEKADVQKTWNDDKMPMKLRMLAEKVYGNTPGGFKGDSMLKMMMSMEDGSIGSGYVSHMQVNRS